MDAFGRSFEKISLYAPKGFTLCTHVFSSWFLYKVARLSMQSNTVGTRLVITSLSVFGSLVAYPLYMNYSYWRKRRTPTYPSSNRIACIMKTLIRKTELVGESTRYIYRHFPANIKIQGGAYFFSVPIYRRSDEQLSHAIMTTHSEHFQRHSSFCTIKDDSLGSQLFISDKKWLKLMTKFNRFSFNTNSLLRISLRSAKELALVMDELAVSGNIFDLRDLVDRYAIDIIGNCALDLQCNALRDPNSAYKQYRKILPKESVLQGFINLLTFIMPNFMRFLKPGAVDKHPSDFLEDIIRKEIDLREAFNLGKCDFLHVLLQLKNRGDTFPGDKSIYPLPFRDEGQQTKMTFTYRDLQMQTWLFFFAGFETFASTMTFCLYELSRNPSVQDKLRKEIKSKMKQIKGNLSLNDLNAANMPYLDVVIQKTLRKYPPVPVLHRKCTKDFKVPGTNQTIQEGREVMIPLWGLQSEEYHKNPDEFNLGRRECLGEKFGLMEAKLGIIHCLKEHAVVCEATSARPVKMNPKSLISPTEGAILLKSFTA